MGFLGISPENVLSLGSTVSSHVFYYSLIKSAIYFTINLENSKLGVQGRITFYFSDKPLELQVWFRPY